MGYFDKIQKEIEEEFEIVSYEDTLTTWIIELEQTNPDDAISWGYKQLDDKIWYMFLWQLVLVWGSTWSWKSTFVNEIAKNISKQWKKVLKFTLEDRLEDRKKQDLFYEINKQRRLNWKNPYPYNDFMSNNIISPYLKEEKERAINILIEDNKNIKEVRRNKETQIDLENLEKIIKIWIDLDCKLIILDHLQEFKNDSTKERQDLKIEEMMYKIKNIWRKYRITIILIAHFKKINWEPNENSFKDSIAVAQVPNKVLLIHRDKLNPNWITDLIVVKNREKPDWTWKIELAFDIDNLIYTNILSNKQKTSAF